MARFTVNEEFVASLLELKSELGFIIEEGLNLESMETIEQVSDQLDTLIQNIREERAA